MVTIHMMLLLVNATVFGVAVALALGKPSRLRAFPVSSSVIVACQLVPAMVAMALECLLMTAVFNAMFKVNWPLWGPALSMSVALAVFAAVIWLTEKSLWHFLILGVPVSAGFGMWYFSRYGMMFKSLAERMWRMSLPPTL